MPSSTLLEIKPPFLSVFCVLFIVSSNAASQIKWQLLKASSAKRFSVKIHKFRLFKIRQVDQTTKALKVRIAPFSTQGVNGYS